MATKKENLPLTVEFDDNSTGTITYANEVIAIIAGVAANEVDGVAGMCSGGGITEVFGRNKNITKGVKVELGTEARPFRPVRLLCRKMCASPSSR